MNRKQMEAYRRHRSAAVIEGIAITALGIALLSLVGCEREEAAPEATPEPVHIIETEPEATEAPTPLPTDTPEHIVTEVSDPSDANAPEPEPTPVPMLVTDEEIVMIAKTIYAEARGIYDQAEQAAIAWCVLNRADAWGMTPTAVMLQPNQVAYTPGAPTVDDYGRDLVELARDVAERWSREHAGETDVGRVLPAGYLWYWGDGARNWFRDAYRGGSTWHWTWTSPYAV